MEGLVNRATAHELNRPDLREPRPVQALERSRAHESPAHGSRRAGLTVQALEARERGRAPRTVQGSREPSSRLTAGRAHRPSPRSTRARPGAPNGPGLTRAQLTAPSRPSKLDRLTAHRLTGSRRAVQGRGSRAGPARPSRAAASPGPGSPARSRPSKLDRLTGSRAGPARPSRAGLTVQGRAHRPGPGPRSWTGSRAHGLDRPDLRGPGSRSRAGLTVQAPRSWTGSRAHGSPSGSRSKPSKLDRLTGSRRAGLTAGRAHGPSPSKLDRLTGHGLTAGRPGP